MDISSNPLPDVSRAESYDSLPRRRNRKLNTCIACQKLKRKCSRTQPCSNCQKTSRECVYPPQSKIANTDYSPAPSSLSQVTSGPSQTGRKYDATSAGQSESIVSRTDNVATAQRGPKVSDMCLRIGKFCITERIGGLLRPNIVEYVTYYPLNRCS